MSVKELALAVLARNGARNDDGTTPQNQRSTSAPARNAQISSFPHCPRCLSYALYRRNNVGLYECLTCGMQEIDEATARRVH